LGSFGFVPLSGEALCEAGLARPDSGNFSYYVYFKELVFFYAVRSTLNAIRKDWVRFEKKGRFVESSLHLSNTPPFGRKKPPRHAEPQVKHLGFEYKKEFFIVYNIIG